MKVFLLNSRHVFGVVICLSAGLQLALANIALFGSSWRVQSFNGTISLSDVTLPGDVYSAFYNKSMIVYPYYRHGDVDTRWIAHSGWNFSRVFELSLPVGRKERFQLVLSGLDAFAHVRLNDVEIGRTDNMFRQFRFDIPTSVLRDGANSIEINFLSAVNVAKNKYENFVARYHYFAPPECNSFTIASECHVNYIRKMQSSFSWDWGPAFPTMGQSDGDLSILQYNSCYLLRSSVLSWKNVTDDSLWDVLAESLVQCVEGFEGTAVVELVVPELNLSLSHLALVRSGLNNLQMVFQVSASLLKLWWPNGNGEQHLYTYYFRIRIEDKGMSLKDVLRDKVSSGFRTIELVQHAISQSAVFGLTFSFRVNDVPIFLKGSNWIPADSFLANVSCERVEFYFRSMKAAHMNAIRVWGGGRYESECFYELADRYGMLLWQDFMFACSMYPADAQFLSNVKAEVTYQVQRLKSHPSILIYAGNNENELALVDQWYASNTTTEQLRKDYLALYKDTIWPEVAALDQTRPFVLSSPSNGQETVREGGISSNPGSNLFGDVHFYDYSSDAWNPAIYPNARCVTEFGFESLPNFETLQEVLSSSDLSDYFGAEMLHRQRHPGGNRQMLDQVASQIQLPKFCWLRAVLQKAERAYLLDEETTLPDGSKTFAQACAGRYYTQSDMQALNTNFTKMMVYLTQVHQAVAIKTEVEVYRRQRSFLNAATGEGFTMCALFWQLNDIWQGPSWSSIDYAMRWKMLHYYAVKFYEPLLISPVMNYSSSELDVFVVSDLQTSVKGCVVHVEAIRWGDFSLLGRKSLAVGAIEPLNSALLSRVNISDLVGSTSPSAYVISVLLNDNKNSTLSQNVVFPVKLLRLPTSSFGNVSISETGYFKRASLHSKSTESFANKCAAKFVVRLRADGVAPFVWLNAEGIKGLFSDNGFVMLKSSITIIFCAFEKTSLQILQHRLSVVSLASIYQESSSTPIYIYPFLPYYCWGFQEFREMIALIHALEWIFRYKCGLLLIEFVPRSVGCAPRDSYFNLASFCNLHQCEKRNFPFCLVHSC